MHIARQHTFAAFAISVAVAVGESSSLTDSDSNSFGRTSGVPIAVDGCNARGLADSRRLESTLTVLEPALRGGNQGPQLDKIQRWLRDCIEAMPRRQGSAGADREATALYQRIEPYFVTMQQTDAVAVGESSSLTDTDSNSVPGNSVVGTAVDGCMARGLADNRRDERLATWLANLWMSATLASDVMAICPDITHPARRAWGYLLRTLTTLCERCLQLVPDCDVQGTARYMDVLRDYDAT